MKTAPLQCERCGLIHGLDGFKLGKACFDAMQARIKELELENEMLGALAWKAGKELGTHVQTKKS